MLCLFNFHHFFNRIIWRKITRSIQYRQWKFESSLFDKWPLIFTFFHRESLWATPSIYDLLSYLWSEVKVTNYIHAVCKQYRSNLILTLWIIQLRLWRMSKVWTSITLSWIGNEVDESNFAHTANFSNAIMYWSNIVRARLQGTLNIVFILLVRNGVKRNY